MINSHGMPEFEVAKMSPREIPAVAGAHWTVGMSRVADRIEPYAAKRRKPIPRPVIDRHLPTVKRIGGKIVHTGRNKAAETARAISYDLSSLNDKDKLIREVASGQGKIVAKSRGESTKEGAAAFMLPGALVGAGYALSRGKIRAAPDGVKLVTGLGAVAGAGVGAGIGAATHRESGTKKGKYTYVNRSGWSPVNTTTAFGKYTPLVGVPTRMHTTTAYTSSGRNVGYFDSKWAPRGPIGENIYTDKKYRGKGIGRSMAEANQTHVGKPLRASGYRSDAGDKFAQANGQKARKSTDADITSNMDTNWESWRRQDIARDKLGRFSSNGQKVHKGMFTPNDGIRSTVSKMGPDQSELHVAGDSNQRRGKRLRKLPPDAVRRIR